MIPKVEIEAGKADLIREILRTLTYLMSTVIYL